MASEIAKAYLSIGVDVFGLAKELKRCEDIARNTKNKIAEIYNVKGANKSIFNIAEPLNQSVKKDAADIYDIKGQPSTYNIDTFEKKPEKSKLPVYSVNDAYDIAGEKKQDGKETTTGPSYNINDEYKAAKEKAAARKKAAETYGINPQDEPLKLIMDDQYGVQKPESRPRGEHSSWAPLPQRQAQSGSPKQVKSIGQDFQTLGINISNTFSSIKEKFIGSFESLPPVVKNVINKASEDFYALGKNAKSVWDKLSEDARVASNALKPIGKAIGTSLSVGFNVIKATATTTFKAVTTTAKVAATGIYYAFKTVAPLITNTLKTIGSAVGSVFNGIKQTVTNTFSSIQSGMRKASLAATGAISAFIALAKSTTFPQATILERQFEYLRNEIYVALMPAIQMLFPVFERLRVVIYQNREFFNAMGTIAAKSLGLIVEALDWVLQLWDELTPQTKNFLNTIIPIGVAFAVIATTLSPLLPLVTSLGSALLGLLSPVGLILAPIIAIGAALTYAMNSERWSGPMMASLQRLSASLDYIWSKIQDAFVAVWAIVQPALETFVGWAVEKFNAFSEWFEANKEVIGEWATYIGSVVGDVIAYIIEGTANFIDWCVYAGGVVYDFIQANRELFDVLGTVAIAFGATVAAGYLLTTAFTLTWGAVTLLTTGIWSLTVAMLTNPIFLVVAVVTAIIAVFVDWGKVIDWFSLVFSNLGLSCKIAWKSIQYAAQVAWDFINDAFWGMIGSVSGGFMALVSVATTAWHNIKALFSKEKFKSIGSEMGKAFSDTYDKVTKGHISTENDAAGKLMNDIKDLNVELNAGRDKQNKQRQDAKKKVDDAKEEREKLPKMPPKPKLGKNEAPAPIQSPKFETIGLVEMWKKMQESVTGGSMIGLAQRQANAAEDAAKNTREVADGVKKLVEKKNEPMPAVVGT